MKPDRTFRVPYALAVFGDEERSAVQAALLNPEKIVPGERVREFEAKIASLFCKNFGVMVNSGSSANLLAFELLNLPEGSEIITPLLTFATTVAPIVQKKLIPVFTDIDKGTYQINCDQVEQCITKKTRALMIPALIGNIPDYVRLRDIADRNNLVLIEDSCDTLGATINGKSTGCWSDISTTSFYASHIITAAGGGGMLCVNNVEVADRARVFRGWGRSSAIFNESEDLEKRFSILVDGIPYDGKFIFGEIGYNFQPIELQAAFGLVQLKRLSDFSKKRRSHFLELSSFFKTYEHLFFLPYQLEDVITNWLAFPLLIRESAPFNRMDIVTHLEKHGVQTRPIFTGNILRQPGYKNIQRNQILQSYPFTDLVMEYSFMIGCHHGLTRKHINYMMNIFADFLSPYSI